MAPLIVLVIVTLCARLAGQCGVAQLRHWAAAIRVGLAVMFCFTAVAHFQQHAARYGSDGAGVRPERRVHGHVHWHL